MRFGPCPKVKARVRTGKKKKRNMTRKAI